MCDIKICPSYGDKMDEDLVQEGIYRECEEEVDSDEFEK